MGCYQYFVSDSAADARHRAKSYKLPAGQYKRHSLGGLLLKEEQFYREGDIFSGQAGGRRRRLGAPHSKQTLHCYCNIILVRFQGEELKRDTHFHQHLVADISKLWISLTHDDDFDNWTMGEASLSWKSECPLPPCVAAIEIYGRALNRNIYQDNIATLLNCAAAPHGWILLKRLFQYTSFNSVLSNDQSKYCFQF